MSHRSRLLLATLLSFVACGQPTGGSTAATSPPTAAAAPAGPHRLVVFATASLRAPFEALGKRYEADHPGASVELRCEGGARLFAAMTDGARCDVVAIGDSSLMSRFASSAFLAPGSPTELARNRITIVVRKGDAARIRGLTDLARADVRVALGARSSSIGRHARWVLSKQTLEVTPRVEGATADEVLAKVAAGEADAGIVYATTQSDDANVERIDVPEEQNTPVLYSISVVREAPEPAAAAAFRALALGADGQRILHEHGFLPIGSKAH
jgi:molybdate transport system substrate-binding protein